MELAIQLTSMYDPMFKKVGYKYELNDLNGTKVLDQKALLSDSELFNSKSKENTINILENKLVDFIEKAKELYPEADFHVFNNQKSLFNNDQLMKFDSVENVSIQDPKLNRLNTASIMKQMISPNSNKIDANIISVSKQHKYNKSKSVNKKEVKKNEMINTKLSISQYDKLNLSSASKNKMLYLNQVLKNKRANDIYLDIGFQLNTERKRFGFYSNFYQTKEDQNSLNHVLFKDIEIKHGDLKMACNSTKNYILNVLPDLMRSQKNITINYAIKDESILSDLAYSISQIDPKGLVKITSLKTPLRENNKTIIEDKIGLDIAVYLKELSNPKNVILFTDGSVNLSQKISGSGTIVKFGNKEEELVSTNKEHDSYFAELQAVYNGIKHIEDNKSLWKKNVFIVYDCDFMAHTLTTNSYRSRNPEINSVIKHIKTITKKTGANLYFHGVKSHTIDGNTNSLDIDFSYNKKVDLLAKKGALIGLKNRKELISLIDNNRQIEQEKKNVSSLFNKRQRM